MPEFLSDPSSGMYLLLVVAVAVLGGVWYVRGGRDRSDLQRAGIAAGVLLLIVLTDLIFESPREQAVRKVQEMAVAVTARKIDDCFRHVSDEFRNERASKQSLRTLAEQEVRSGNVERITVWNFDRGRVTRAGTDVTIFFQGKVEGQIIRVGLFEAKATFGRDPDGQYRLKGLEVFHPEGTPGGREGQPMNIPGL